MNQNFNNWLFLYGEKFSFFLRKDLLHGKYLHKEYQKLFILCSSFLATAKHLSNQALKSGEIQYQKND